MCDGYKIRVVGVLSPERSLHVLQISNKGLVAMLAHSREDAQQISTELSQLMLTVAAEGEQELTQYVSVLQVRHTSTPVLHVCMSSP